MKNIHILDFLCDMFQTGISLSINTAMAISKKKKKQLQYMETINKLLIHRIKMI